MPHVPPFRPDPRLFPFDSRWFESAVGPVHYLDEGPDDPDAPPLLLLHGNPTWSFVWRGVVIRLRDRFRCIVPDLPGFGLSVRPEGFAYRPNELAEVVRGLVRHLDLRGLTIAGQDWGGPLGLRVAVDELSRLRALVMGNTWYGPIDTWTLKAFAYAMSSAPLQDGIIQSNLFVERLLPLGVKLPLADEVLDHYRDAQPSPGMRAGVAALPRQLLEATDWLAELAEDVADHLANVPLLLAWGMGDRAFPPAHMGRFRDDFRLVRVERLDARHFIQEDAPAELAAAIAGFLTDGPAAR